MAIYNVAVMCVLGVAVSFVLQDELNASFILIAIFIIFCTTGTLCLVFVPKVKQARNTRIYVDMIYQGFLILNDECIRIDFDIWSKHDHD